MAEVPASHKDILQKRAMADVATVASDGSPRLSPVWFDWDGKALRFSTIKRRAKFRNIEQNPRVSIVIIDPDEPYRYLEIRGEATYEEDPSGSLIKELSLRYDGEAWTKPTDGRVIVSVTPSRVIAYGD